MPTPLSTLKMEERFTFGQDDHDLPLEVREQIKGGKVVDLEDLKLAVKLHEYE